MVANGSGLQLDELAQDLLDLLTRLGLPRPRLRRSGADLRDLEFLALAVLHEHGTLIVGRLQRLLGVLPAQMSRIIRALETRPRPLIACQINAYDKRKIDVHVTAAGVRALEEYKASRVRPLRDLLRELGEPDLDHLGRVVERLTQLLRDDRRGAASTNTGQVQGPAVAG